MGVKHELHGGEGLARGDVPVGSAERKSIGLDGSYSWGSSRFGLVLQRLGRPQPPKVLMKLAADTELGGIVSTDTSPERTGRPCELPG